MTDALAWIRKSKGADDDIGLEQQRDKVRELAESVDSDYDELDLGVQTGFSSMTRDGGGLLDQQAEVQAAVEKIRTGAYDFIVALDDRRVCRDDYFAVIKYAMRQGGAEFVYVRDVADDELTHDLKRRIERDTKEEEIEKSRHAVNQRLENGYYHGRPPKGLRFTDDKTDLEPDPEEFDTVQDVIDLADKGRTYREINDETDVPIGTISRILDRRELYEQHA